MEKILLLHIETSGDMCSVCLTVNGEVIGQKNATKDRSHSKRLTLLIQELLTGCEVSLQDLSAIVLSKGPGSYTGLRVGSSVAKGLCYSLDIPIITLNTLTAIASRYRDRSTDTVIISMLLARKEEVYLQVLDGNLKIIQQTLPSQLSVGLLDPYLKSNTNRIVVCGNATELAKANLPEKLSIDYQTTQPTATDLTHLSLEMYKTQVYDDIAYFNLDYIKSPNITKSKKKNLTTPIVKK